MRLPFPFFTRTHRRTDERTHERTQPGVIIDTRSVWTSIVLSSRIRPEHAGQGHGAVRSRLRAGSDITWRAGILPELIRKQGRHCNEGNKTQY